MAIASELKLRKVLPERLGALGLDEVWLQEQTAKDPSLLNLGELEIVKKEKAQPAGGRIDFVMADPDSETRYEIEVMLGDTDASHIIRTIEYWDVERQRYPLLEHRAVIVAEGITARCFNVIRLLNRAVPIIAIQLSALRVDYNVVLQFTRVLDTYEFGGEPEDESAEPTDRAYWERKANAESLAVVDEIRELVEGAKVVYNKYHVALSTSGYNFCWFHPRKAATHCHMHLKVGVEKRAEFIERLNDAGIDAKNHHSNSIRLYLSVKEIREHRQLITDVLRAAEEWSHR